MTLTRNEELVLEACKNACKEAPLKRSELKEITHLRDRENREIIGNLRDKGYRIAHSTKGYWYAAPEEYADWIKRYTANAFTILKRKAAMDRFTEGQVEMSQ